MNHRTLRLSRQLTRWRISGGAQVIDSSQVGASTVACQAMFQQTLAHTQLRASQIDLIKVQAAGSRQHRQRCTRSTYAVRFFYFTLVPPLLSLKPLIGHTLGSSGAAEIALLLAILEQQKWPCLAFETDTALGMQLAAKRPKQFKHILVYILGFGGSHSCIAIEDTDAQNETQDL